MKFAGSKEHFSASMKSNTNPKKKSFLLKHFIEIFEHLSRSNKPSDVLLSHYFSEHKYLGSTDRRILSQSIFDLLRLELKYEILYRGICSTPKNTEKIHATMYLFFLDQNPFRDEQCLTSDLLKLTTGTRKLLHEQFLNFEKEKQGLDVTKQLAYKYAFSEWFVESLLETLPQREIEPLLSSLNESAPVVLRVNGYKAESKNLKSKLANEGIDATFGNLSIEALICQGRPRVFQSEAFKQGWCEIQDEGSQLISLVLNPKPKEKVLDACAGGGGKTLHMAALMKGKGTVFAYDNNTKRFGNIRQRMKRSGLQNIQLLESEERLSWLKANYQESLDAVLIDAPCSGSGTLRRNPDIKKKLKPQSIVDLNQQQFKILSLYSHYVKPGGRLVYATCSLIKSENDDIVEKFVGENPHFIVIPLGEWCEDQKIPFVTPKFVEQVKGQTYLKLRPDRDGTDGFFAAILQKTNK